MENEELEKRIKNKFIKILLLSLFSSTLLTIISSIFCFIFYLIICSTQYIIIGHVSIGDISTLTEMRILTTIFLISFLIIILNFLKE